jgi:phosphoribosylformylglycinamidine synthase
VEDVRRVLQPGFKREGDVIALLGVTEDDLSISEYVATINGVSTAEMIAAGKPPRLNLDRERAVQNTCLLAAESGLLQSAHDCSDGGLVVAVAECCFSSLNRAAVGADIELTESLSTTSLLFSESPSRIIVSLDESSVRMLEEIATRENCPITILGLVGGNRLKIRTHGEPRIDVAVSQLEDVWRSSLAQKLQAEAMALSME